MLNRLEKTKGLRDVKYIVYFNIWKYKIKKVKIKGIFWRPYITPTNIDTGCYDISLTYPGRSYPVFNWRDISFPKKLVGHKISSYGRPVNIDLPDKYAYSSPDIEARIY